MNATRYLDRVWLVSSIIGITVGASLWISGAHGGANVAWAITRPDRSRDRWNVPSLAPVFNAVVRSGRLAWRAGARVSTLHAAIVQGEAARTLGADERGFRTSIHAQTAGGPSMGPWLGREAGV